MDLDQACRIDNPGAISFNRRVDRYIQCIGRENIRKLLPAGPAELAEAWLEDENLNNIPLAKWDEAAGYPGYRDRQGYTMPQSRTGLMKILKEMRVSRVELADCVCILKRCAELEARDYLSGMLAASKKPESASVEIWAVFEHSQARPDKMNRHNIFDFDCVATFLDEPSAIRFETENFERRVRKLIRIQGLPMDGIEGRKEGGDDA